MHEMQTIVADECGVCPSDCHVRSFGAAFAKSLWLFVMTCHIAVHCSRPTSFDVCGCE